MPQESYIVDYCIEKFGIAWVEWNSGLAISPLAWYIWVSQKFDWLQMTGGIRLMKIG